MKESDSLIIINSKGLSIMKTSISTPEVVPQSYGNVLIRFDSGNTELLRPSDVYHLLAELDSLNIYKQLEHS